jgi:AbrB family looped-hinge helix DNA binding protein
MVRARITSKGQITLPVEIRRRYGLRAGDEVAFHMDDSGARVVPLHKRTVSELRGMFPATRPYPGKQAIRREIGKMLGQDLERQIRRARPKSRTRRLRTS